MVLDVVRSADLDAVAGVQQVLVDVSQRDEVHVAVKNVIERHGHVSALVAGAAIQPRTSVLSMEPSEWSRVQAVNLDGVVWAAQAVLPTMMARGRGAIIVFTSGLASAGRAEASAYAATKAALVPWAKSLAAEIADDGIRVNVIAPGVIDTPQFRAANPEGAERAHWSKVTGIGSAEDVLGPLLFLLSDAATMTGSTLSRERAFGGGRG